MIKSATIQNFRAFKEVKLKDCKRLNVVLGRNASGKTALLEAFFMALASSVEVSQRFRTWRSLVPVAPNTREAEKELFKDLFNDFDLSSTISIELTGTGGHQRTLRVNYDDKDRILQQGPAVPPLEALPIKFRYSQGGKKNETARAVVINNQLVYTGAESLETEAVFFPNQVTLPIAEVVDRFSRLSINRREDSLVNEIKDEFPFIDGIQIASPFGSSNIYADVKGMPIITPIGLVSSGITKIITILVAIAAFRGGVVLIDEIENGVYFDRYESLWRSIYRFAEANDVQIFASTHSDECLKALSNVAVDWKKDVSFIRALGGGHVEQFHGSTIFGAMEIGEIR